MRVRKGARAVGGTSVARLVLLDAVAPVNYPAEIAHAMHDDLARMRTGTRPYLQPGEWRPVPLAAEAPERELPEVGEGERLVPDLLGKTARAALRSAQEAGLMPRLSGSGVVAAQNPEPFTVVADGTAVVLRLEAPDHVRPSELSEGQDEETAASRDADETKKGPELAVAAERGPDG